MRTLEKVAREQYTDDAPIKQRLLELQLALEAGDISEEDYVKQEADIIRQLREIERHKRELAGLPSGTAEGGLVFRPGDEQAAGASVVLHQDTERKRQA